MTAPTEEAFLTQLNLEIAECEQRRDDEAIAQLNRCLSTDLVFRRADGSVVGKEAFMNGLRGPSPFVRRESRGARVTILGERALVIVTVIGIRENASRGVYRNVRVFFRHGAEWRLEIWFNDDVTSLVPD